MPAVLPLLPPPRWWHPDLPRPLFRVVLPAGPRSHAPSPPARSPVCRKSIGRRRRLALAVEAAGHDGEPSCACSEPAAPHTQCSGLS